MHLCQVVVVVPYHIAVVRLTREPIAGKSLCTAWLQQAAGVLLAASSVLLASVILLFVGEASTCLCITQAKVRGHRSRPIEILDKPWPEATGLLPALPHVCELRFC
jgi:hypothetical protein